MIKNDLKIVAEMNLFYPIAFGQGVMYRGIVFLTDDLKYKTISLN